MLLVNLFGAPGAGKSTGALYITAHLKAKGINAEIVTEYAKDKVWENNLEVFTNQLYIAGHQSQRVSRLNGKVEVAVTDSPLLLSVIYCPEFYHPEFDNLMLKIHNQYNNINYYIDRAKKYNPVGRYQTEEESDNIGKDIQNFLIKNNIDYTNIQGTTGYYDRVVDHVVGKLKNGHK